MAENQTNLAAKLRRLLAELPHVPRAFALVWAAARYWTVAWIALILVQGLLPVAMVWLTKQVVDGVVVAVKAGGDAQSLQALLIPAGLMAGVLLLTELLRAASGWVRAVLLITHRLTIAMRADIIYVMTEGWMVESGSHDQLVRQAGLYSQSWKAQMLAASRSADKS
jgi:ABC-type multidrug transport system fused ATPase/permease subunit